MDWLAAETSPAIVRISETVRVSPPTIDDQSLHQLVLLRTLAKRHRQVAVGNLLGGWVMSFIATISVFRLFLMVLKSPW